MWLLQLCLPVILHNIPSQAFRKKLLIRDLNLHDRHMDISRCKRRIRELLFLLKWLLCWLNAIFPTTRSLSNLYFWVRILHLPMQKRRFLLISPESLRKSCRSLFQRLAETDAHSSLFTFDIRNENGKGDALLLKESLDNFSWISHLSESIVRLLVCLFIYTCGTHLGETKLVASIVFKPLSFKSWMNFNFVAVETIFASFWRPSRGPTSTILTKPEDKALRKDIVLCP